MPFSTSVRTRSWKLIRMNRGRFLSHGRGRTLAALGILLAGASLAWASPECGIGHAAPAGCTSAPILRRPAKPAPRAADSPYRLNTGPRGTDGAGPGTSGWDDRRSAAPLPGGARSSDADGASLRPYTRIEELSGRRYTGTKVERPLGPDVTVYGVAERSDDVPVSRAGTRERIGGGVRVQW